MADASGRSLEVDPERARKLRKQLLKNAEEKKRRALHGSEVAAAEARVAYLDAMGNEVDEAPRRVKVERLERDPNSRTVEVEIPETLYQALEAKVRNQGLKDISTLIVRELSA